MTIYLIQEEDTETGEVRIMEELGYFTTEESAYAKQNELNDEFNAKRYDAAKRIHDDLVKRWETKKARYDLLEANGFETTIYDRVGPGPLVFREPKRWDPYNVLTLARLED